MARLNAKTVRFNIGSGGGAPDITPEMIAGAIAFVPPGIGRELLCFVWWPAGSALTESQLQEALVAEHMREWVRREDAYQLARTRLAVQAHSTGARWATREFAAASTHRWPAIHKSKHDVIQPVETYANIRAAVLTELRLGDYCLPCEGSGNVPNTELVGELTECGNCGGTGHRQTSDRWRARAAGVHVSTFNKTWAGVYEWTLSRCRTAMSEAEGQFQRAVD